MANKNKPPFVYSELPLLAAKQKVFPRIINLDMETTASFILPVLARR